MKKRLFVQIGVLGLFLVGVFSLTVTTHTSVGTISPIAFAQGQIVTPTVYCLGACPTATPSNGPQTTTAPSGTAPTSAVQPTGTQQEPCQNETAIAHSKKHKKKSNGAIGNFIERLLNFLRQLLELIMRYLGGGGTPTTPTNPQPTGSAQPTQAPVDPCIPPQPTEPAAPTTAVPTTSASTPVPSGAGVTTTIAPTTPAGSTARPFGITIRSGKKWPSGAWGKNSASGAEAFGTWRGRPIDVAVLWPPRQNWNDITGAGAYNGHLNKPYKISIGVPPFPENSGGSLSACASGAYDSNWKTFGNTMKSTGLEKNAIIRLGWEFNGNWYEWSAHNPSQFAECWKKVYTAVESVAPGLIWDWNVNRGPSQSAGNNVEQAYPGDAYVDIIGVDSYDGHPPANNEAGWNTQFSGPFGLTHWLNFAKKHNKKISFPEWGVTGGSSWAGNNGGDDPNYIQKMHAFFDANAADIAYESYFDENASYWVGSIYNPVQHPNSSAKYNELW